MAVIEDGANSGRKLAVNTENALPVSLTTDGTLAGFARILDSDGRSIVTTENGALSTSTANLLFFEQVDGTSLNTNVWTTSASGMSIAQASGFITLNSAAALTANSYAILTAIQQIPMYGHLPLRLSTNIKVPIQPQANLTIEVGIGQCATTAAPTDGAFFRWNSAAQFQGIVSTGGVETPSAALTGTITELDGESVTVPPASNTTFLLDIILVEDQVQFLVNDVEVAVVNVPAGFAYPTSAGRLPFFARVYTSGTSPAQAPVINIGQIVIVQEALNQVRPWREFLAIMGRGAYQSPVTAFGQTANHANSTSPSSATLSNTAAGYTTLGGRYQFAAPAGAATDFALFSYQVPAGYRLIVTGIAISCVNTGAIGSAVTPTIVDWSAGVNASAVSLATADGAGTWASRRIPLGNGAFGLTAVIGAQTPDIVRTFDPPLVVDSQRFFHIITQIFSGAATASQILRGDVMVNAYWE